MSMLFWSGIAFLMGLQYRPVDPNHFWSWLGRFLMDVALRGLAFALWSPPIFALVAKYLRFSGRRFRYLAAWSLGAIPFVLLQTSILWALVAPYDDALQAFAPRSFHSWLDLMRGAFADQTFIYIAVVVAAHGYEYLKRLRTEERERYEYQQALTATKLQALRMQLQPHFLFNTLHGISTLIDSEPRSAKAMIVKLSSLLRTALDSDGSDLIPLQEELKFAREYLELEKMRFGNRLRVEWSIPSGTTGFLVPQMVLQPLVENAIRYGVASAREGGWIEISARADTGVLNLQVRNSTTGQHSNGTGLGLRNTESRLKYLYSGDAALRFTVVEDRVATVTLTLPALSSQSTSNSKENAQIHEDPSCAFSSSMTNH